MKPFQCPSAIQVQETSLHGFCFYILILKMPSFWLKSQLLPRKTIAVLFATVYNTMTLQNMYVLKQYRSSCFCSSLVPYFKMLVILPMSLISPLCCLWILVCNNSLKSCFCASLMKSTNVSLAQSMQDNVKNNLFSHHVKLQCRIHEWICQALYLPTMLPSELLGYDHYISWLWSLSFIF